MFKIVVHICQVINVGNTLVMAVSNFYFDQKKCENKF